MLWQLRQVLVSRTASSLNILWSGQCVDMIDNINHLIFSNYLQEIDILSLPENAEGQLSERNKRTIGVLRELFPELSKV